MGVASFGPRVRSLTGLRVKAESDDWPRSQLHSALKRQVHYLPFRVTFLQLALDSPLIADVVNNLLAP